jgi:GT2 family glycosyltransferase
MFIEQQHMNSPRFSIVIPTYGRPVQLELCLRALARMNFAHDEFDVVVVDDGGDRQQEMLALCERFQKELQLSLLRQLNAGPASARNNGARHAQGEYLVFIDDDCEPHPDWLASLKKVIARYPDCMIGGRTLNRLEDNIYSTASQLILNGVYAHYNARPDEAAFVASNNMAMPRELFERIGGFDISFRGAAAEDRELCQRWVANGLRIVQSPDPIMYHSHRLTLGGFLRQHFNYGRGAYRYHEVMQERERGDFREQLSFHTNLKNWLLLPFGKRGLAAGRLFLLILTWQVANAVGFFWEALRSLRAPVAGRRVPSS